MIEQVMYKLCLRKERPKTPIRKVTSKVLSYEKATRRYSAARTAFEVFCDMKKKTQKHYLL